MGLFDLLSKDKRDARQFGKNLQRAVEKYAQSADRMVALEALADDGSDDALYGLLKRFALMYDKTIEDEQEKRWVFDTLVAKGAAALPAVKRYLMSADSVSWPLRVLQKIAGTEQELTMVEETLAKHEPGYERDPTKKIQLIGHLAGLEHARAPSLVLPYLADMDEGVRFTTVEALIAHKDEAAREPLLALFASDAEDSLRIRSKIAEGFADLGWLVEGHRGGVEKKLPEGFAIDREGHVRRRGGGERK